MLVHASGNEHRFRFWRNQSADILIECFQLRLYADREVPDDPVSFRGAPPIHTETERREALATYARKLAEAGPERRQQFEDARFAEQHLCL